MKTIGSVIVASVALTSVLTLGLRAQQIDIPRTTKAPASKNPLEGNDAAVKNGMGLFRSRCADCHGVDARGVRSPDLTQVWASGRTDEGLFLTIKNGVANTEMPANPRIQDAEAWQILAYLRTLAAPAPNDPPRGNAENGARIFSQPSCRHAPEVYGGIEETRAAALLRAFFAARR